MNDKLMEFLESQTPEQVQEAFRKIREERGDCPNDITVEEYFGITSEEIENLTDEELKERLR